jgi:Bacterial Ig-like domain (group 2)
MIPRSACVRLIVVLLLAIPVAATQSDSQRALSLAIDPPHLTLNVGQEQKFSVEVAGAPTATKIQWLVREHGASVTQNGVFTARIVGIYHVVALAIIGGQIVKSATTKVTVDAQYDGPIFR